MSELRFETTVGTIEVWMRSDGEVQVFLLDAGARAIRAVDETLGEEAHLALVFEDLGMTDREAAWYAKEVWRITRPDPGPDVEKRRKRRARWGITTTL